MRNPNRVLNSLESNTQISGYKFERLYRNLYNPKFYLIAYQNIYSNSGSMTKGIDDMTLDGMGMERINKIIGKIKDYSYRPNPVRRQYIKKANGKLRPLGIPSADDKLVQEVIRILLESIYEPTFSNCSHGFRPRRSCHTALNQIQKTFIGTKWFVEGDIVGCFDNIDQHILINLLRKKIHDEHFIGLIWKFLRAGYMESWTYKATYSGAAQGSVISPILANIYMHELDHFMEGYKLNFDRGCGRHINPEYKNLSGKYARHKHVLESKWNALTIEEKDMEQKEIKAMRKQLLELPSRNPMDHNFRRIVYSRYADDFLIGVIGSKADAIQVRTDIRNFLIDKLNLALSMEKTHITHAVEKVRFLGYDITVAKPSIDTYHKGNGQISRFSSGRIRLYVPKEKWIKSLLQKDILWIKKDADGKEHWMPVARKDLINKTSVQIVSIYNAEIRGLYNYYSIANNATVISKFYYVMEYSMYKTLARKFRCSMVRVKKMFSQDKRFAVPYTSSKGTKRHIFFYDGGFRKKNRIEDSLVDAKPVEPWEERYQYGRRELIVRMLSGKCELCGDNDSQPKVYQVKKLSDLKPTLEYEAKMLSMRRKTLVLCQKCYNKIHS